MNFDAPEDQDGYVHRTGRTGRAGRDGLAITFVMGDQARDIGAIANKLGLQSDFERAGFAPHVSQRPQHQPSRNGGTGRGRSNGRGGRSRYMPVVETSASAASAANVKGGWVQVGLNCCGSDECHLDLRTGDRGDTCWHPPRRVSSPPPYSGTKTTLSRRVTTSVVVATVWGYSLEDAFRRRGTSDLPPPSPSSTFATLAAEAQLKRGSGVRA